MAREWWAKEGEQGNKNCMRDLTKNTVRLQVRHRGTGRTRVKTF